uniref:Immunoglobulin domain-containing protein n=1 Tax=Cyprinus carpio TaxID=7962 RepID=A0A8C2QAY5_CYPCA
MAHFGSDLLISVKSAFFFNGKVMNIFTFFLTLGGVCLYFVCGASAVDADRVSVMEGDTVTLYSDVELNQTDRMIWLFGVNRIAVINKDQRKICEDDKCKERFKDRLKVNQTGSLTIMNTRTTDSGEYTLKITSRNIDNIFSVTVHDVSAAERDEMKRKSVKEGESVTLDPGVVKNPNYLMRWYFNDICIAVVNGNQSKIYTDDQCDERLRDRLKLNNQTGSLNITNITNTDSGDYKLKISSSRFSIMRSFTVTVSDSGSSSAAAVVAVLLLLLLLVAAVIYYKRQAIMKCIRRKRSDPVRLCLQL